MTKLLITGANGYIAEFIIKHLRPHYQIVGIDLHDNAHYDTNENCQYEMCDIRDLDKLDYIFKKYKPEIVIHLAALILVFESFEREQIYYQTNVQGTRNILNTMKKYNIMKIIFSSTCAVFDDLPCSDGSNHSQGVLEGHPFNPRSPYSKQKKINEDDILRSGLDFVIFRFFNVVGGKLGKEGTLFANTINCLRNGERPIIYGNDYPTRDGTTIRDYIHPLDLARAYELVIKNYEIAKHNFFNLGSGKGYSTKEIVQEISNVLEAPFDPEYKERRQESIMTFSNSEKAEKLLGWKTIFTLKDIIHSIVNT